MSRPLALLAGLLLLLPGAARGASASLPGPGGPVDVEAGLVTYDAVRERFLLEGGVRLRRGAVLLRARTGSYDPRTGEVDATGDVLLTGPGRVVAADGIHAVLDGAWEARGVVAFYKDSPLDLSRDATIAEAEKDGRNRLSVRADRASGNRSRPATRPSRFSVEGVRLTLCDCCGGAPSWEIRAAARRDRARADRHPDLAGGLRHAALPLHRRAHPRPAAPLAAGPALGPPDRVPLPGGGRRLAHRMVAGRALLPHPGRELRPHLHGRLCLRPVAVDGRRPDRARGRTRACAAWAAPSSSAGRLCPE